MEKSAGKENSLEWSKKQAEMDKILADLKKKLAELEELKKQLSKENTKKISVQKTKEMLEEIIVPPLQLIKEKKTS